MGPDVLLYLRLVDQDDGDACWQGTIRLFDHDGWEVEAYGGSPYPPESVDAGLESP